MQVGHTYRIQSEIAEDDSDNKSRRKYIQAKLLKEFPCFYLFQTKNYKTTVLKQDYKRNHTFIREV